jgi:predicted nucleotidyltransferase
LSGNFISERVGIKQPMIVFDLSLSFFVFLSKKRAMFIDNYKIQIKTLCKENKVKNLFVFGSVLTASFNENSDIDFIVDIDSSDPIDYADHYFTLKFSLEDLLNRPIDLLENKAIKNPFLLQQIEQTKALVYGSGN